MAVSIVCALLVAVAAGFIGQGLAWLVVQLVEGVEE